VPMGWYRAETKIKVRHRDFQKGLSNKRTIARFS
jgi:hypothetical protein